MNYPEPIAKLINDFMKLPGIGYKTAVRLSFYTLEMDREDVESFSSNLYKIQKELNFCSICGNITQNDPCSICLDESRDQSTVLVLENARDVMSMEQMQEYHGLYHVLNGVISPMDNVVPDDLNIKNLINRLRNNSKINEIIMATNATSEGEATAMYIARLIKPSQIKVTRLAYGLSVGSDIEYADQITLYKAVEGRIEI